MADIAAGLGAVAATIAAIFAGANLYISGQREHRRWIREVLIDAYVELIRTSYDAAAGAVGVLNAHKEGRPVDESRPFAELIDRSHLRQTEILTRLRLLAGGEVITAAEALHLADHVVVDLALDPKGIPSASAWDTSKEDVRLARERLVDAARDSVHLPVGVAVDRALSRLGRTGASWLADR